MLLQRFCLSALVPLDETRKGGSTVIGPPQYQSSESCSEFGRLFSIDHLTSAAVRYTPWANFPYGKVRNSAITAARWRQSRIGMLLMCLPHINARPLAATRNRRAMNPRSMER